VAFAAPPSGRTDRSQGVCERGGTPSTGEKAQRLAELSGAGTTLTGRYNGKRARRTYPYLHPNLKPEPEFLARGVSGLGEQKICEPMRRKPSGRAAEFSKLE
jgi:hypothetical protein